jgi:hypothetical protein
MELFEPIGEALIKNGISDHSSEIPFSFYLCLIMFIIFTRICLLSIYYK